MFNIGYSRQLQTDVGLMVSSSLRECVDLVKCMLSVRSVKVDQNGGFPRS